MIEQLKQQPSIQTISEKKLIGKRIQMSLANNRTSELWKNFMPLRGKIQNKLDTNLYSLQIYDSMYFKKSNLNRSFEKWALVEVSDFTLIPKGMDPFVLESGLYAVFHYAGSSNDGAEMFRYIFEEWLPASGYELDNRPHFELLGDKYKNNDPSSEEDIWIPIKTQS